MKHQPINPATASPQIEWQQWPSWPLRLERWENTPFIRDCLQSIADEAEDRDEAVYWAAQAAADGCAASLRELREIFDREAAEEHWHEAALRYERRSGGRELSDICDRGDWVARRAGRIAKGEVVA